MLQGFLLLVKRFEDLSVVVEQLEHSNQKFWFSFVIMFFVVAVAVTSCFLKMSFEELNIFFKS